MVTLYFLSRQIRGGKRMSELINLIKSIYKGGEISYVVYNYVNRDYWNEILREYFPNNHLQNLTDFNYNKCFTICLNLSETTANLGTKEFEKYLEVNSELFRMEVQISVLAPYGMVKYLRYFRDNDEVRVQQSNNPYKQNYSNYDSLIKEFLNKFNLKLLDDTALKLEVPGVKLELREGSVSVYNCLFEDSYSYFPYGEDDL